MVAQTVQPYSILIVEDDDALREIVAATFEAAGNTVWTARSGEAGLKCFHEQRPEIIILDVWLPQMSGWDVLKYIRLVSQTPVVMLTTLREPDDQVKGLTLGADAYLSKPFDAGVLVATVEAVLRRSGQQTAPDKYADSYLTIDVTRYSCFVAGQRVDLTTTEFKLLSFLLANAGRICTYVQIADYIWGIDSSSQIDNLQVHVSNLRRKIEPHPRTPRYILTERGFGYQFQAQA